MTAALKTPLCDIVLLTWNRADLLKPCIESILKHTDVPSRVLVVDNASTDPEAIAYLNELKKHPGTPLVQLEVIQRANDDGVGAGMNEGLSHTKADWICLANNDILVTEGWLSEMIRVASANPQIGLLNPMSNQFGLTPKNSETVDDLARRLRPQQGTWLENWSCVGFCMLMPRPVFQKVGLFDPLFGFAYHEDADYSLRAAQAGFLCAIAEGAYVYHHGGSSLKEDPQNDRFFSESGKVFFKKWNRPLSQRIAWVSPRLNGSSKEEIRQALCRLANEDHKIWFFCTQETASASPNHYNVVMVRLPKLFFSIAALWKIAAKKKKFQRVIHSPAQT